MYFDTIPEMDKATLIQKARELEPEYAPSDDVKAQLSGLTLVAIIGPTGVGKSTIIEKSGIPYVKSDMTRALRPEEKDGVDINQRSDYDKLWEELCAGEFAQYLIAHTNEFYGTKASSYPKDGACIMPIVTTALAAFEALGFGKIIKVYIVPPSFEEWQDRIKKHGATDLEGRMIEARESLGNALAADDYIFLMNDDITAAMEDLHNIVNGMADMDKSSFAQGMAVVIAQKL